jgi:general L-amino acid transport system substrate-binding protein
MMEQSFSNPSAVLRYGRKGLAAFAAAVSVSLALAAHPATAQTTPQVFREGTLKTIERRGELRCGVSGGLPGFSVQDEKGGWSGLDVDFCRALAAAIFDDPSKVAFAPLPPGDRFAALVAGAVDVLARNTTWTLAREATMGIAFAAVNYYDGQGFMARKGRGRENVDQLGGAKICVQSGTTTELNLDDYFSVRKAAYEKIAAPNMAEAMGAYADGRCDVIASDVGQLFGLRVLLDAPDEHVILPDVISKEPLAPAVRVDDAAWLNVVKWTHFAMVEAEELGVSQATLDQAMESEKAETQRLLGSSAGLGQALDLPSDWAARIIRHVGNYGETFDRNVGDGSTLKIPRGLNRLWTAGGLQYSPPFR